MLFFMAMYRDVVEGATSFLRRDIARYYYPIWQYAVQSLKSGAIPLWNPFSGFGVPFLANVQSCVFYPPMLFLYLPNYTWGFNFYILFHLALASFGAYLWMRDNKVSLAAAMTAGFAYGLSGYLVSATNLTISLCSAAYFPWALLVFRRAMTRSGFFWKGVSAVALCLQYLAGDPAIFFITVFVLFLFAGYRVLDESLKIRRLVPGALVRTGLVILVFLGLAAFQWLPFCEFLLHSTRKHLDLKEAMSWSVLPSDLWGLVVPFFSDFTMSVMDYWMRQSWLENYYSGVTVVLLAAAAVVTRKEETVRLHFLLALGGVLLSLGRYSPLYLFLHSHLPLLGWVRYPARFFFLVSFSLACLAGFGWDAVVGRSPVPWGARRSKNFLAPGLILLVLVGALWLFTRHFDRIEQKLSVYAWGRYGSECRAPFCSEDLFRTFTYATTANSLRSLLFGALTLAGFFSAVFAAPRKEIQALFFATLVSADLGGSNFATEPRAPVEAIQEPTGNVRLIQKDPGLFRIFASPKTIRMQTFPVGHTLAQIQRYMIECLTPNLMLMYRFQHASAYDSIYPADTTDLYQLATFLKSPDHNRLLDSLNIKYLVSPSRQLGPSFRRVRRSAHANLFLNSHVLPRAYLVREAMVVTDRTKLLDKLWDKAYDPLKEIYLESEPGFGPWGKNFPKAPPAEGSVSILEYEPQRVRMEVTVTDRPWLFFSDAYYPGWKAWVDGKPAKILKANGAFRALALESGVHEIVWRYDPAVWKAGVAISTVSFFALFCYCVRMTAWRRV